MDETKVTVEKTAVYIGRRITSKDKLGYFWHFEGDQKPVGYLKRNIALAEIGERWVFAFKGQTHTAELVHDMSVRPRKITSTVTPYELKEWVAKDAAHYQHDVDARALRKYKTRETEFDKALAPLVRLVDAVGGHEDRAALIAHITSQLWRRR